MIFVNLPVRDLAASTAFYVALGGMVNSQFSGERSSSIVFSDAIGVMLLTHGRNREFSKRPIADACRESHALFALSVDNRDMVDATLRCAIAAGGKGDRNPVQDQGWMCNRSAEDPNGYFWEVMWMDAAATK